MDTIITTRYCVLLRLMSIEFCVPVAFLTTPPGSRWWLIQASRPRRTPRKNFGPTS